MLPWLVSVLLTTLFQGQEATNGEVVLDICGGIRINSTSDERQGRIVTGNKLTGVTGYDVPDDAGYECRATIQYPPGGSVWLTFAQFDMEWEYGQGDGATTCPYDYLSIDGARYCGHLPNTDICISGGTEVEFGIFTDGYTETADVYQGFDIDFHIYDTDQCTCKTLENEPCVFPFKYLGEIAHQCLGEQELINFGSVIETSLEQSQVLNFFPFCATEVNNSTGDTSIRRVGQCDTGIRACRRDQCLSRTGRECIFPYTDAANGLEYNTCRKTSAQWECPVAMGRDYMQPENVITIVSEPCTRVGCGFQPICSADGELLDTSRGQIPAFPEYDSQQEYPSVTCAHSLHRPANGLDMRLTVRQLSVSCPDALRLTSSTAGYSLCGDTRGTSHATIHICLPTTASNGRLSIISDLALAHDKQGRTGFLIDYETGHFDGCGIAPENLENEACSSKEVPVPKVVSSPDVIVSWMSPQPYPNGLTCLWRIEGKGKYEGRLPYITISRMHLGEQLSDVPEMEDTVIFGSPHQQHMKFAYANTGDDAHFPSYCAISPTANITFTSSEYFNFHKDFKITVDFIDPRIGYGKLIDCGLCLSEDSRICKFPFEHEGREFHRCTRSGSQGGAWCKDYKDEVISCNMSINACAPYQRAEITEILNTLNSLEITFDTEPFDGNTSYLIEMSNGDSKWKSSSECTGNCSATFVGLEPATSYTVTITVTGGNQTSLIDPAPSQGSATTQSLPNFHIARQDSNSYSSRLKFSALPFTDDGTVRRYTVMIAEDDESSLNNITLCGSCSTDLELRSTRQISDFRLYPMVNIAESWNLTVGTENCSVGNGPSPCNGPLRQNASYQLWIIGEAPGGLVASRIISGILTSPDDVTNVSITNATMTTFILSFYSNLPADANFNISVSRNGEEYFRTLFSKQDCVGHICEVEITGLQPSDLENLYFVSIIPLIYGMVRDEKTLLADTAKMQTSVGSNDITWDPIPNAETYEVVYGVSEQSELLGRLFPEGLEVSSVGSDDNNNIQLAMIPGVRYQINVTGITAGGSDAGSIRGNAIPRPGKIDLEDLDLSVGDSRMNLITIITRDTYCETLHFSLSARNPNLIPPESGEIEIQQFSCRTVSCINLETLSTENTMFTDELIPGVGYTVAVFGSTGISEKEPITVEYDIAPDPVQNLRLRDPLETSFDERRQLYLTWDAPRGVVDNRNGYLVEYGHTQRPDFSGNMYTSETSVLISKLTPGSAYEVAVSSISNGVRSEMRKLTAFTAHSEDTEKAAPVWWLYVVSALLAFLLFLVLLVVAIWVIRGRRQRSGPGKADTKNALHRSTPPIDLPAIMSQKGDPTQGYDWIYEDIYSSITSDVGSRDVMYPACQNEHAYSDTEPNQGLQHDSPIFQLPEARASNIPDFRI